MGISACIKKIDKHLAKDNVQPLIIDIQNKKDLASLMVHYKVGNNLFIAASDYCNTDEFPRLDSLFDMLSRKKGTIFVIGLTGFLMLQGEQVLVDSLKGILGMTVVGHVVVITYQCKRYLDFHDPRLNLRVCIVDGETDSIPTLIFTKKGMPQAGNGSVVSGLHSIGDALESCITDKLYIETEKRSQSFPYAIYKLGSLSKAYDVLLQKDQATLLLHESFGTPAEWDFALSEFDNATGWADLIDKEFGNHNALELVIPSLNTFNNNRKWLYFIALKLYGAKNNWCLNEASKRAESLSGLTKQAYRCILDIAPSDNNFVKCYASRKALLLQLGNPLDEVIDFCKIVLSKEKTALYYLTDTTQKEKELVFLLLDRYAEEYTREQIASILKVVYPALYQYLLPFRFKNELLDTYFQEYKYQKILNRVFPDFESIVEDQAKNREYNLILEPRYSKTESIDRTESQLYFIDAFGVEYLGYVMSICSELNMIANVTVCSCALPSITSKNKEFLDFFADSKYPTVSIKDIDDIKHHGKDNFDYQQTKLPIHLAKELDIIRDILTRIKERLADGSIQKAIIISDHGASRLAVIHETENIWEMSSKGEHSGRCCLKSDVDEQPQFATDADDFWALANYDRFKGGRKASVEVHGGATLEEVTVPIIELTYLSGNIEVQLMPINATAVHFGDICEIEVSYRKKAAVKIFATQALQNVSIAIDGKYYDSVPYGDNFYTVEMPDIKKAKTYSVDVYSCGNIVAQNLLLVVKKEGAREKDLL